MIEHENLWRWILPDKWNTNEKSSWGAWALDMFYLFSLWQAFLRRIPTFGSILRVLPIHYHEEIWLGCLSAGGLEKTKNSGKWEHEHEQETFIMCGYSCHPNGTRTRDLHYEGFQRRSMLWVHISPPRWACRVSSGKSTAVAPLSSGGEESEDKLMAFKRGPSSHYHGKSKSFGNLQELGLENAKDLRKKEHPFNKRRRILLALEHSSDQRFCARSSSMAHISSLPVFLSHRYKNEEGE